MTAFLAWFKPVDLPRHERLAAAYTLMQLFSSQASELPSNSVVFVELLLAIAVPDIDCELATAICSTLFTLCAFVPSTEMTQLVRHDLALEYTWHIT